MSRAVRSTGLTAVCLLAIVAVHQGRVVGQEEVRPLRRITLPTLVSAVAFSPDGKTLVAWDPAGFSSWDAESGRRQAREQVFAKACERVTALPRAEGGATVGVHCRNRIVMFNVATTESLGAWELRQGQTPAAFTAAPDGSAIAAVMAGALGRVEVGDRSGAASKTVLESSQEIESLAFSADGRRLAAGAFDSVQVWEVAERRANPAIPTSGAFALNGDGTLVAVGRSTGPALVDAQTGNVRATLDGPSAHLRFSPDGARLIGWTNQQLVVWDVATGAQQLVLKSDRFVMGAVSPDGTRLATVSLDLRGEGTTTTLAVWGLPSAAAPVAEATIDTWTRRAARNPPHASPPASR